MAKFSAKQLAMAWINDKLDASKINPEAEEFQALSGGKPLDEKLVGEAAEFVKTELAKMKVRFQHYVDEYVTPRVTASANPKKEEAHDEPKDTASPAAAAPQTAADSVGNTDATSKESAAPNNGDVSA